MPLQDAEGNRISPGGRRGNYKSKRKASSSGSTGLSGGYGGRSSGWSPSKGGKKPPKSDSGKGGRFKNAGHFGNGPMRASGYGHEGGSKTPSGARSAANRRVESGKTASSPSQYRSEVKKGYKERAYPPNRPGNPNRFGESMKSYRKYAASKKLFKGDYYGPDEFKGNLGLVDKWRRTSGGKEDPKKFLKRQSKRSIEHGKKY